MWGGGEGGGGEERGEGERRREAGRASAMTNAWRDATWEEAVELQPDGLPEAKATEGVLVATNSSLGRSTRHHPLCGPQWQASQQ